MLRIFHTNGTAYLFTFLTIIFWGGAATAFKSALQQISPLQLLCIGSAISLLILTLLMGLGGKFAQLKQLSLAQWLYLMLLGAVLTVAGPLIVRYAIDDQIADGMADRHAPFIDAGI